jgi:hypothetical protein
MAARVVIVLLLLSSQSACSLLFPTEAGESLSHYDETAPQQFEPAPEFELIGIDGQAVKLQDIVGEKPVVVQLGSYSCPVFRYRRFDMQELQRDYADRVHFVVIYTQEAHPVDAINPYVDRIWNPVINKVAGVNVAEHKTLQDRQAQASLAFDAMELNSQFLVDNMDNATWRQYGAAPSAAYVVGLQGMIRLRQPWINPRAMREVLDELLTE